MLTHMKLYETSKKYRQISYIYIEYLFVSVRRKIKLQVSMGGRASDLVFAMLLMMFKISLTFYACMYNNDLWDFIMCSNKWCMSLCGMSHSKLLRIREGNQWISEKGLISQEKCLLVAIRDMVVLSIYKCFETANRGGRGGILPAKKSRMIGLFCSYRTLHSIVQWQVTSEPHTISNRR